MSATIVGKVGNVRFNTGAVCAALVRMGYERSVDFHVSNACDHGIVDYMNRTKDDKVQIWIKKDRIKNSRTGGLNSSSNEIGFRASEDGSLEVVNNQHDSETTFTEEVVKEFVTYARVEALKAAARKQGHKHIAEVKVGKKIHLRIQ